MLINTIAAIAVALWIGTHMSVHQIREGYVGVYWRGGALRPSISQPGLHTMIPLYDTFEEVQVTMQTDSVSRIPCGTSGGVMVTIENIEVVNMLKPDKVLSTIKKYGVHYDKIWIFDKIHHEINQFCSKHTLHEVYIEKFDHLDEMIATKIQEGCDKHDTGIDIIAVRVTKPSIPASIAKTFVQLEESKQNLLLQKEQQRLLEVEQKTILMKARAEAERVKDVKEISLSQKIMEAESSKKIAALNDEMISHQIRSKADAEAYSMSVLAEAEKQRLTTNKLRETLYLSLANNTKIYFGDSIPNMFNPFLGDQKI
eukprot:TRINITY_DN13999_c0_g1_i1.p1 TRINITY_DN13999_c0_g1~~TRINITY_DN13999_c0_g1_i1.p1  ORF type:complete len:342 (+),score=68.83 TRINITY_DN13999_c0_g1_i1:88-1026(+)